MDDHVLHARNAKAKGKMEERDGKEREKREKRTCVREVEEETMR